MDTGELSRKTDKLLRVMGYEMATSQRECKIPLTRFQFSSYKLLLTVLILANIGRGEGAPRARVLQEL